jgi:hypothetical protein
LPQRALLRLAPTPDPFKTSNKKVDSLEDVLL